MINAILLLIFIVALLGMFLVCGLLAWIIMFVRATAVYNKQQGQITITYRQVRIGDVLKSRSSVVKEDIDV